MWIHLLQDPRIYFYFSIVPKILASTVKFQCESSDFSVSLSMNPAIPLCILELKCGSLCSSVNPGILVWLSGFQYPSWEYSVDVGSLVWILRLYCETWHSCGILVFQCGL